jgi:ATP-dependent exoDNAse (exonuclease V) beta subunit
LTAPAVEEQHDTASHVTALATFAACPRKYYLGTYLGLRGNGSGPAPKLPATELGSQVHALLAGIPVANPDPEAERLADTFRKSPPGRRAAQAVRVEREFDFVMSVEDLVLRGQVDLWFEEGGELVIVDYKTDAVTAVEALQRADDYALQLRLYSIAVERIAGRPPDRAFLHFLRPNRIVEIDLTPSLLDSPEQIVRDLKAAQDGQNFRMNEGSHCRRCEFFADLCPAGH